MGTKLIKNKNYAIVYRGQTIEYTETLEQARRFKTGMIRSSKFFRGKLHIIKRPGRRR
jgi:hypothetical protein